MVVSGFPLGFGDGARVHLVAKIEDLVRDEHFVHGHALKLCEAIDRWIGEDRTPDERIVDEIGSDAYIIFIRNQAATAFRYLATGPSLKKLSKFTFSTKRTTSKVSLMF